MKFLYKSFTVITTLYFSISGCNRFNTDFDSFSITNLSGKQRELAGEGELIHKSGVIISWNRPRDELFHRNLLKNEEMNINSTFITENDVDRAVTPIRKCLNAYPEDFIGKYISRINLVRDLQKYGVILGGLQYRDQIYISMGLSLRDYSREWIESTCHHEIAHILQSKKDKILENLDWNSCNKDDFEHGIGGVDAIKAGIPDTPKSELFEDGFLREYGKASESEDFSVFAENMFTASDDFWEAVKVSDIVKCKANLMVEFYSSLDERFDYEFFKSIYRTQ